MSRVDSGVVSVVAVLNGKLGSQTNESILVVRYEIH